MLSLDDPRWAELDHAYGKAGDIPAMLRQLRFFPSSEGRSEPWFTLWSALAHQGDVYSASFAAVPHIIEILAKDPGRADSGFIALPAWIEICRYKRGAEIPLDLESTYLEAIRRLPSLAVAALSVEQDEGFVRSVLCAVAVVNGKPALAEAVLDLSPEVLGDFWEWFYNR